MGKFYRDIIAGQVHKIGDRDSEVMIVTGAGAPDVIEFIGCEGETIEPGTGSLYIDSTGGFLYENRGTKISPDWDAVGAIDTAEIADGAVTNKKLHADVAIPEFDTVAGYEAVAELYDVVSMRSDGTVQRATYNDPAAFGIAYDVPAEDEAPIPVKNGVCNVKADANIAAGGFIKASHEGAVTRFIPTTVVTGLAEDLNGTLNAFANQPAGGVVNVSQAGNEDNDMVITVIGLDGADAVITEEIALHATDTTTPVAGSIEFTTIIGAFAPAAVASNTLVKNAATDTVCTIASASATIGVTYVTGADVDTFVECYLSTLGASADAQDDTHVTFYGVNFNGVGTFERLQLDNEDPSSVVGSAIFAAVQYIITGELTHTVQISAGIQANPTTWLLGRMIDATDATDTGRAYVEPAWRLGS